MKLRVRQQKCTALGRLAHASRQNSNLVLVGIFLLAFAFRAYGINSGFPYPVFDDETFFILHALRFGTGDLNPHWFLYPTLYMYALFVLYALFFVAGWILKVFASANDFVAFFFANPSAFYLIGRIFTVLIGSFTVVMLYPIGKRLFSKEVGVLASFFLALTFLHVRDSHVLKSDIPMTFLVVLSLYLAVRAVYEGRFRYYALAGLVVGLAASTKYNAYPAVVLLITAHLLNRGSAGKPFVRGLFTKELIAGLVLVPVGFLLGTPYAALDFQTFLPFVTGHLAQSNAGWLGGAGQDAWIKVVTDFLFDGMGAPLAILSLCGIVYGLYRRTKAGILLASFPIAYYVTMAGSKLNFDRYWDPVLPFLALAGAKLLVDVVTRFPLPLKLQGKLWSQPQSLLNLRLRLAIIAILFVLPSAYQSFQYGDLVSRKDTRIVAREWIQQNIPSGAKMALDINGPPVAQNREGIRAESRLRLEADSEPTEARSYKVTPAEPTGNKTEYYQLLLQAPVLEPSYYALYLSPTVANRRLEYYVENGFQYLVINDGIRGAFLRNPEKYPQVAEFFNSLEQYPRVKEFLPVADSRPGPSISVYELRQK